MLDDTTTDTIRDDVDQIALTLEEMRNEGGVDRDRTLQMFHLIHRALENIILRLGTED